MKKAISLLLVFLMALGALTGCGSKETTSGEGGVLKVGIPTKSTVSDYDDNAFTNYLEEKAGVQIEFIDFSSTASESKKQLALMCGAEEELPDVLLGFEFGHYVMNQYGEDGYFVDLTEYIDKYGENYKKAVDGLEDEIKDYITEKSINTNDNGIYGLPRVICTASDDLQSMMYINHDWLNAVGMSMPTTPDELRAVLQAFATKDPNGNGEADEVPMIGGAGIQYYIINSYMYYDAGRYNVTNGQVWDPVKTDEFRQALIYGNQLVKDELYSSLSFTVKSTTELKNMISPAKGESKVGIFVGNPSTMTSVDSDVLSSFTAMPALNDVTGKGGYTVVVERKIDWTAHITKDCENPDLAMKFLDLFYTDETISFQRHGVEGTDWVREEGKNNMGTDSYVKVVNTEAFFSGNSTWNKNMLGIMTHWNYLGVTQTEAEGRMGDLSRLGLENIEIQKTGKQAEERCIYMIYTTEEYEIQEEKLSNCNTYITEMIAKFFAGEKDPANDTDWNTFLSNLEKLGRSDLMKVAQDAYSRK